jgi:hypothetical protein
MTEPRQRKRPLLPGEADGFPPEYRKMMRENRIWWIRNWVVLGIGAVPLSWGYVFLGWAEGWGAAGVITTAVFIWYSLCAISDLRTNYDELTKIVPYFEGEVPGDDTFFSGYILARNCAVLDRIAAQAGVIPLSWFGFEDDYPRGHATWYEPEQGLRTIDFLMQRLSHQPDLVEDAEGVLDDIDLIRRRLSAADECRIRFCLHLRADAAYSGMEFDSRKGKY